MRPLCQSFGNVVFPVPDIETGVAAWRSMLDREPAFVGADFAVFSGDGLEIGLTAAPWADHPLVFWKVDDVDDAHRALVVRVQRHSARSPTARSPSSMARRSRTETRQPASSTSPAADLPCSVRRTGT